MRPRNLTGMMTIQETAAPKDALSDPLLTVAVVCRHTGFTERTIRAAIAKGRLRIVRPGGLRSVRVPASALEEWLRG